MARILIVGCGCRGQELARALRADGHAVRGTTRDAARCEEIAATGAEPWIGDPARIATLTEALEHVTIVAWLMGSAQGTPEAVAALHRTRLERLIEEAIDTTVRGIAYEAAGSLPETVLRDGRELAARACAGSEIPFATIDAGPADPAAWLADALRAIDGLLGSERPVPPARA